ncbi:GNAT family N-acetyltransferase [Oerskovia sp. M15]
MTEAARIVVDWAFDDEGLGLSRMVWCAYTGNWPSRRVAWRLGFRVEGRCAASRSSVEGAAMRGSARCWSATRASPSRRGPPSRRVRPLACRARCREKGAAQAKIGRMTSTLDPANPFAADSTLPYQLPDFTTIREEHYLPPCAPAWRLSARRSRRSSRTPRRPRSPTRSRPSSRPVGSFARCRGLLQRRERRFDARPRGHRGDRRARALGAPRRDLHGRPPVRARPWAPGRRRRG